MAPKIRILVLRGVNVMVARFSRPVGVVRDKTTADPGGAMVALFTPTAS